MPCRSYAIGVPSVEIAFMSGGRQVRRRGSLDRISRLLKNVVDRPDEAGRVLQVRNMTDVGEDPKRPPHARLRRPADPHGSRSGSSSPTAAPSAR